MKIIALEEHTVDRAIGAATTQVANENVPYLKAFYRDDLMDVWEHRFQPYRDREWMRTGACATCRYFKYCLGGGMHLRDGDGKLLFCHLERIA